MSQTKPVHIMTGNIDPAHIADILEIEWEYAKYKDPNTEKELISKDLFVFYLAKNENYQMYLSMSKNSKYVSIDYWTRDNSSLAANTMLFRDITNVICNEEFRMLIIETGKGKMRCIVEIKRYEKENGEAIGIMTNINLDKKDYEENYKNWW